MIRDCIKMFAAAFCADKRLKISVTPDADALNAARFISLLSGRCEIGEYQGAAFIKPLKKLPATSCAIMVPHCGRQLFFLIAGIVAQFDIIVRFDDVYEEVSDEELEHISRITQGQLRWARRSGTIFLSSMLDIENPLFAECEISEFSAGLCLGAILARADTLVDAPETDGKELLRFTVDALIANGATVDTEPLTGFWIIRSELRKRVEQKNAKRQSKV